ncbi:MAG TPA: gamma-glutamylcyclotransferase [Ktedonobacteraceae bacterium]
MEENSNTPAESNEARNGETPATYHYAAPGVPIVRNSTPRPLPFLLSAKTELPLPPSAPRADFPAEAPDAPPLPEEPIKNTSVTGEPALTQTQRSETDTAEAELAARGPANEFVWLFEYALDMDPVRLNRPERLDGSAFAYGPAMLKGHRLTFEGLDARGAQVLVTLTEARNQHEMEVWGILYRVPRRYTRGEAGEMPLLDKVHYAETFVPVEIQVREPYRQREVGCVTYIASEATRQHVQQLPPESRLPEPDYFKRLLQVARRQKLPASYLRVLEELVPPAIPAATPLPTTPPEQDTEPLPALMINRDVLHNPQRERERLSEAFASEPTVPETPREHRTGPWEALYPAGLGGWLLAFAIYICLLMGATLVLAVFQGLLFWPYVFNEAFTPLGVPWYVLVYGVLGGCISCIVSLSRPTRRYPPAFVVLTWFMRPFLGAILGALAYLVLNSGAILISAQHAQHFALCSATGALAGFCEGKLFARRFPMRL